MFTVCFKLSMYSPHGTNVGGSRLKRGCCGLKVVKSCFEGGTLYSLVKRLLLRRMYRLASDRRTDRYTDQSIMPIVVVVVKVE